MVEFKGWSVNRGVRRPEKANVAVTVTRVPVTVTRVPVVSGEQARGPEHPLARGTVADTKDCPAPNASDAPLRNTGRVLKTKMSQRRNIRDPALSPGRKARMSPGGGRGQSHLWVGWGWFPPGA